MRRAERALPGLFVATLLPPRIEPEAVTHRFPLWPTRVHGVGEARLAAVLLELRQDQHQLTQDGAGVLLRDRLTERLGMVR
jgi:hypothetical protein